MSYALTDENEILHYPCGCFECKADKLRKVTGIRDDDKIEIIPNGSSTEEVEDIESISIDLVDPVHQDNIDEDLLSLMVRRAIDNPATSHRNVVYEEILFVAKNGDGCSLKISSTGQWHMYIDDRKVTYGTAGDRYDIYTRYNIDPEYNMDFTEPNRYKTIYTNHKGRLEERVIVPRTVWWGTTPHHPNPQWFLQGVDYPRDVTYDFALDNFSLFDRILD
jgi:hypothetical protein